MPVTDTLSPSGSTPKVGTVIVSGSPAVTVAEKLRATGDWFTRCADGSGTTATRTRAVWARSFIPSAKAAYSMVTNRSARRPRASGT